eukprot:COSAG02_NODE_16664_length_1066_cov_0.637022_1_plen_339_part_10
MRKVPFPDGVSLVKTEPQQLVGSEPANSLRTHLEEHAPQGQLKKSVTVDGITGAVLCVASKETQHEVRIVAEQMQLQYVGCRTIAAALEHLRNSEIRKSSGLPVVGGEPQYLVAVVAALGMSESELLFSKDNSSELLAVAAAAQVVAIVFSHTACSEPHMRDMALRAVPHAVVNTAKDLSAALTDAGIKGRSKSNKGTQDFNDVQPTSAQSPGIGHEVDELPEFIQNLSDVEVKFYRELLSKGKQRFEFSKLMIMGPGRVGKTSLLRQLTGQAFDEMEVSTRGVDACSIDVRTWQHSRRGDTTGASQSSLSLYREALAMALAEREMEKRRGNGDSTGGS